MLNITMHKSNISDVFTKSAWSSQSTANKVSIVPSNPSSRAHYYVIFSLFFYLYIYLSMYQSIVRSIDVCLLSYFYVVHGKNNISLFHRLLIDFRVTEVSLPLFSPSSFPWMMNHVFPLFLCHMVRQEKKSASSNHFIPL